VPRTVFQWQEQPAARPFTGLSQLASLLPPPAPVGSDPTSFPDPGNRSKLTPLGDVDGDGSIEMLAAMGVLDAAAHRFNYNNYLVRFRADRTLDGVLNLAQAWPGDMGIDATKPVDLDNDGRVELVATLR